MVLYSLLDRLMPRSYLAKVLAVVVVLGHGPVIGVAALHMAGRLPPGLVLPALAVAFGLGLAGAALGLAAILRPIERLERAVAAFERGEAGAVRLPETHGDVVGRLMARAATLFRTTESRIGEAERQADLDPLTGLLNRRGLERALAARHGARDRGALLMLDLDHFKRVNDDHGHDEGDRVLREVAALLRSQMRRPDLAARFGGEEFVVYVASVGREPALQVAERLRMAVEDRIAVAGRRQTASFGVAPWPPGDRLADVLKRADAAVYKAKSCGRNCVRFSPDAGALRRPSAPAADDPNESDDTPSGEWTPAPAPGPGDRASGNDRSGDRSPGHRRHSLVQGAA